MTNKIVLRDVIQSDLPIFYEHQLDKDATKMASFPSRTEEAFMAHWAKIMSNTKGMIKTILFDEQVAGNVLSFEMEEKREIGYWLGKEFWGKGIASESLKQFLGHEMKRPLFAHVSKQNPASKKVLEKCGFKVIGEDKWRPIPEWEEVEEFILKLD